MRLNDVVKRQKRNFRPQNTPILSGGFRADVVSTRSGLFIACQGFGRGDWPVWARFARGDITEKGG
jgi:hypothetical protein